MALHRVGPGPAALLGAPTGDWRALANSRSVLPFGLGQAPAPAPGITRTQPTLPPTRGRWSQISWLGQLVLAVLVVIVLLYLAYRLGKARTQTPMAAVRKMSTNRLSKALYERLERNGRGSDRTRSALAQLGR